jgi:membrane-associated PAP2 superfamily phosphatase
VILRAVPRRWLCVPAVLALALVALDLATDVDRALTRHAFDAVTADFPLRTDFWLEVVMHHWTKYAVTTLGCGLAAMLLLTFALPRLGLERRTLLFLTLAIALAPASVSVAKGMSARHCPWDVDEFGGYVRYERLFETAAPPARPGHCFPAGHASTGFALMAFYFAAHRRGRRKAARAALGLGMAAGVALGWGRVLQGAHFPSHVAWSGLLSWVVMVGLYAAVFGRSSRVRCERQHPAQEAFGGERGRMDHAYDGEHADGRERGRDAASHARLASHCPELARRGRNSDQVGQRPRAESQHDERAFGGAAGGERGQQHAVHHPARQPAP